MKTLYLAGGCFWGLEAFLQRLPGVQETLCGYANGIGDAPTRYQEVCSGARQFAEAVKVTYDDTVLSTEELLLHFFRVIDPTSYHRQGNDFGVQYRSGIYYVEEQSCQAAKDSVGRLQEQYRQPICTEVLPLTNFFPAEEYHQQYLEKNPGGYCHINLRSALEPIRFCHCVDDPIPWENIPGLYVDSKSGTPLFSWRDFERTTEDQLVFCAPIGSGSITIAHGDPMPCLICTNSGAEIGTYGSDCMYYVNKSSLAFIPLDSMAKRGYGDYRI